MKRKVVVGTMAAMSIMAMGAMEASAEDLKIGLAVQTLSNQVWAQQAEQITSRAEADGNEITVVECKENANTQIGQIENFISAGTDIIIVQPQDPEAIEDICAEAREEGIKVVSWDEEMENSDINWIIENYDLGVEIGTQAAEWKMCIRDSYTTMTMKGAIGIWK